MFLYLNRFLDGFVFFGLICEEELVLLIFNSFGFWVIIIVLFLEVVCVVVGRWVLEDWVGSGILVLM